jgi:hypothetical protein
VKGVIANLDVLARGIADARTIHGSFANTCEDVRVTIGLGFEQGQRG